GRENIELRRVGRDGDLVAQLAVHLHRQLKRRFGKLGRVVGRPRATRQRFVIAQALPDLLGQVGGEGGKQEREGLRQRAGDLFHPRQLVVELDQLRDGGVEAKGFDIFADLFDRALELAIEGIRNRRV